MTSFTLTNQIDLVPPTRYTSFDFLQPSNAQIDLLLIATPQNLITELYKNRGLAGFHSGIHIVNYTCRVRTHPHLPFFDREVCIGLA